ncbi:chemokine (C-X-C motif) ligand 18a, duplicate 1 isoform X1 [Paramormyrops kingsleyae]|uniref:chemokine (C-X-C motif) ligand 18a, duplicate 1 isoform X1 n=1 Tax=Paramormyrops kingsleyae TaxID=1676925 RepID=UPI003B977B55
MPAALGQILLLFAVALHAAPGESVPVPKWLCECPQTRETVPWKSITDFQVIPKSSFCSRVEIVVTQGNAKVCLNPESKQGQKIQECWDKGMRGEEGRALWGPGQ